MADFIPDAGILKGRLAPSPTGALHVGNARTFLCAWLSIRSRGGRIVLRIEDLERPAEGLVLEEMLSDLRWLGFDWDEGPVWGPDEESALSASRQFSSPFGIPLSTAGDQGPYIQSQRLTLYRQLFEELKGRGLIYPCSCSRADYAAEQLRAPHEGWFEPRYPGTCRHRSSEEVEAIGRRESRQIVWRVRVPEGPISFEDAVAGPQTYDVQASVGDFVVFRSPNQAAYQLAVVADDIAMGITEVVRGDDLLPSTARQLFLYSVLGGKAPSYGHIPLVVGPDGKRIAKRHGDSRIRSLRDAGIPASRIVGILAAWTGLGSGRAAMPADLVPDWSWKAVRKDRIVLDAEALALLSGR